MSKVAPAVPSESGIQGDPSATVEPVSNSVNQLPEVENTRGAVAAVGHEFNMLDQYLYKQAMLLDQFAWSKTDAIGTVLWRRKVSPFDSHSLIRWFTKPYNFWRGGFEYSAQIAGTGFHAGKLMFVYLPPNLNIDDYDISQLTTFSFFQIDPKSLEIIGIAGLDTLIQKAHFNQRLNDGSLGTFASTGGTVAGVVMLPLNTSSTGSSSINIQIFQRLAPDFAVSVMKPVAEPKVLAELPDISFKSGCICKPAAYPIHNAQKLSIWPNSVALNVHTGGHKSRLNVNADGPWINPQLLPTDKEHYQSCGQPGLNVHIAFTWNKSSDADCVFAVPSNTFTTANDRIVAELFDDGNPQAEIKYKYAETTHADGYATTAVFGKNFLKESEVGTHTTFAPTKRVSNPTFRSNLGEHIITFNFGTPSILTGASQVIHLSDYIVEYSPKWQKGYDAMYMLEVNGRKTRYVRLSEFGWLSTTTVPQKTIYNLSECVLRFERFIQPSVRLPDPPSSVLNEERLDNKIRDLESLMARLESPNNDPVQQKLVRDDFKYEIPEDHE